MQEETSAQATHAHHAIPRVDDALCNLCGLCVEACPCGALTLGDTGPVFDCLRSGPEREMACWDTCEGCLYQCEEVCPTGAISCEFSIVDGGCAYCDEASTEQDGQQDQIEIGGEE